MARKVMVGDVWKINEQHWKVTGTREVRGSLMFWIELEDTDGLYVQLCSASDILDHGVLVKRPGVTQAAVPPEVAERRKRRKAKLSDGHRAMLCEHANEVPTACPCAPDCYCKEHTCKPQRGSGYCTHAESPTGPPGGVCKCEKGGCYCWRQPGGCGEPDPKNRYAAAFRVRLGAEGVITDVLSKKTSTQIPHTAACLVLEALDRAGYRVTLKTRPTSRPATSPSTPPRQPRPRRRHPRSPS